MKKAEYEPGQINWDEIDITVLHCPKCQEVGGLTFDGWAGRRTRRWRRFWCTKGKEEGKDHPVSELALLHSLPEETVTQLFGGKPPPKPTANKSNSPLEARLIRLEEMFTQFLEGKAVELVSQPKVKPKKVAFDLDKYSLETQGRIKEQLLPLITEHIDWGTYKLEKEMRVRHGKALKKQVIIKVKNAYRAGYFGL